MSEEKKSNVTKEIDGEIYREMVISAANNLENEKEEINNLNVFPVPDGDTGVNMSLTMSPARDETQKLDGTVSDISGTVAKNFLRSARGNSGVILSSFFRGLAREFKDCVKVDAKKIASAFKKGTDTAYKSVQTPTEGTILTVMKATSDKAIEKTEVEGGEDIGELFDSMIEAADETLAKTPEMLPVLKQANVVDAGGTGFLAVLKGMVAALKKQPIKAKEGATKVARQATFTQFSTEDIKYPYCTECIVTKSKEYEGEGKCEALHQFAMNLGDSVVFVEDSDIVKVHVHTSDPGKLLSEAVKYGMFYTIKVENMKNQHTHLISEEERAKAEAAAVSVKPEKKYGFVSVCSGEGIKNVFLDLGADQIVIGGQTMNPSTEDMLKAIASTPSEIVFVLPNNSNIYLVSKAAADLTTDKQVVVLKTVSVPQGVSAMFAFMEDVELDENIKAMEEKISATSTVSVTYAAHDSVFDGKTIKEGQNLGLIENKVKYITDTREECLEDVAENIKKHNIITIYYGKDVSEEEAEKALDIITQNVNPYAEVTLVDGGQPVYAYIISGEDE